MSQTIFDDFDALMMAFPNGDDAKVWMHFISIQTDLSFDDQTTETEKACLDELNSHLFEAIDQKSAYSVGPMLRSLRQSLEGRMLGQCYA